MNNKNYFKLFFRRISKDLKQKQLLPLKLLFFMHSSTILIIYPYLTIHMRELGINVEETAIMSAVTPVVAILMPPVAGMIADKIGNFRILLAGFSALGGTTALLLLLVPVGRVTISYPNELIFGVSCSPASSLSLSLNQEYPCMPVKQANETEMKLQSCGFSCHAVIEDSHSTSILNTNEYDVQLHDIVGNSTKTYTFTLTDDDIHQMPNVISTNANKKFLINNERYETAIRKLAKNDYYFPASTLFSLYCGKVVDTFNCSFGSKLMNEKLDNIKITPQYEESEEEPYENVQTFNLGVKTTCNNDLQNGTHISIIVPIYYKNSTEINKHLDLGSCAPRCIATTPRKSICNNLTIIKEYNMALTFWFYLIVRVFVGIVSGTAFAMFEGAVIALLREHKADYGLQRIYATIGGMISSPLSGILIDFASRGKAYTDFRPIFYLYAALKIVSGILMLFINLEFKKPANNVFADVVNVLKNVELIALFITILIMGSAWGFIESFLFWLIQDLGGSKTLMGLTITIGGLAGIPLLVMSGPIIKRIGHANVLFIGFIFYSIRLIGYSIIYNPWYCLIFEAMEAITTGLSFTAAVTYAAKLSTITTDTTVQGILGGLYYAFGKGVGSLIGGYLIKSFGIRMAFQIFSISAATCGVLYFGFSYLFLRHRMHDEGNEITKKDNKDNNKQPIELDTNNGLKLPAVYEDALVNPAFEDTEETSSETTITSSDIHQKPIP